VQVDAVAAAARLVTWRSLAVGPGHAHWVQHRRDFAHAVAPAERVPSAEQQVSVVAALRIAPRKRRGRARGWRHPRGVRGEPAVGGGLVGKQARGRVVGGALAVGPCRHSPLPRLGTPPPRLPLRRLNFTAVALDGGYDWRRVRGTTVVLQQQRAFVGNSCRTDADEDGPKKSHNLFEVCVNPDSAVKLVQS
jgi:hypothetical protein